MKIELTETEACKFTVRYEANFLEIADKRAVVEEQFKKAPCPGFRPGKASIEALRLHYGKQIDESLKRALAEDAYHNTLFENKNMKVHGAPTFKTLLLDGGKFTCEFDVRTKPEFELPTWKEMEIPKPHSTQSATEVSAKMMQELRERLGEAVPYGDDDFVQMHDNVITTYEGSVDGQKVESLTVENEMMAIGKGPLDGFDSNLLGMKMGETREFDYTAPEGGLPSLSGKVIHFKVTVVTGSKTTPCALDDELAKKMGKADFKELEDFVSSAAFARVAQFNRGQVQEAVARKLVADAQIKVPGWMSLSEAQYLAQQSQMAWDTMPDTDREKFVSLAEKNVTLSLILDKIRDDVPEAQLTDQEVFEIIKQNLAQTKVTQSLDEVIAQMNRTGYLQILFSRIRDEHTMDYVVKQIKLID
jgi:trigger factor